jgi:hypothetical protein
MIGDSDWPMMCGWGKGGRGSEVGSQGTKIGKEEGAENLGKACFRPEPGKGFSRNEQGIPPSSDMRVPTVRNLKGGKIVSVMRTSMCEGANAINYSLKNCPNGRLMGEC